MTPVPPVNTPVFPSGEFVAAFNVAPMAAGQPFRGPLDPLVMLAWSLATTPPDPRLFVGLPAV